MAKSFIYLWVFVPGPNRDETPENAAVIIATDKASDGLREEAWAAHLRLRQHIPDSMYVLMEARTPGAYYGLAYRSSEPGLLPSSALPSEASKLRQKVRAAVEVLNG